MELHGEIVLANICCSPVANVSPGKESVQLTWSSTPSYRDFVPLIQVRSYNCYADMFQGLDTFPQLVNQSTTGSVLFICWEQSLKFDMSHREDLVGEALDILQKKHDIKRDEIYIQTKCTHDLLQRLCLIECSHDLCNAGSRQSEDKTSANRFHTMSRILSGTKLQRLYKYPCATFGRLISTLISFIHL